MPNHEKIKHALLKNPIGNNISVETWNDCITMILHQADNGKVIISFSQIEQLIEFVNTTRKGVRIEEL